MTMLKIIFSCFLLMLLYSASAKACDAEWREFLENPTEITHDNLAKRLGECIDRECLKFVRPASADTAKLVALIEANNLWAVDVGFLALPSLDGGNLEDVVRSLANFIEFDPQQFLSIAKRNKLSDYQFKKMLLMLPLDTVDDVEVRSSIIQRRIGALEKVNQPYITILRDQALQILKKAASEFLK